MEFFLYTFDSDYLKERFIALENASLLASKLPKATPRIFFTRDIHKDCDCDILVVETLKKDVFLCERTQKLAKTVLVTATPFSSLNALLVLGTCGRLVCMNKGEVLFTTDALPAHRPAETELEKFSKQFSIERSHELDRFASLLDVGMLKRRLWLVGSIGGGRQQAGGPFTLTISRIPGRDGQVVQIRSITFAYRTMFRSSSGEPSELRPLNNIRRHELRRQRRRRVEDSEADDVESSEMPWIGAHVNSGYMFSDDDVSRIREVIMELGGRMSGSERRRRRRKTGFVPEQSEHLM